MSGVALPTMSGLGWFYVLAIVVTLGFWWTRAKRNQTLLGLYLPALLAALIGAKLCYFSVEGWSDLHRPDRVVRLLTGKSILGALLAGFFCVELVKRMHGIRQVTGDFFAITVPLGIAIGRVGCIRNGCCAGLHGWPAAETELAFNGVFVLLASAGRVSSIRLFAGQWFHLYMVAYGVFRFVHEAYRDTPRCCAGFSGYQVWALLLALVGLTAFTLRWRQSGSAALPVPESIFHSDKT